MSDAPQRLRGWNAQTAIILGSGLNSIGLIPDIRDSAFTNPAVARGVLDLSSWRWMVV
jgi:hypothetical protein